MSAIETQIQAFIAGSESEYAFPGLSAKERKLVKTTAEKFGLSSRSLGMGLERQIHIFKPSPPASPGPTLKPVNYSVKNTFVDGPVDIPTSMTEEAKVGPAFHSMPEGALHDHIVAEESNFATKILSKAHDATSEVDTTSTKDSDSESQDAQISVKNSFVHFQVDSKETADPRIVQSMPAGAFAECIEAERAANMESKRGRPSPLTETPDSDIIENITDESSAMLFPSTPNADNQMSFSGHGAGVPMQWIPSVTPSANSITVLPPAQWTPIPESSAIAMPPMQTQQQMLQQHHLVASSTPPFPPQGATAGRTIPEAATVLQPGFWVPGPNSGCETSPPAIPPPQTSPQGPLPQMTLQAPPPSAAPSDAALQESITVLPPALWNSGAPRLENDSPSAIPASQGVPANLATSLPQGSAPPKLSSSPAPPHFMPGTHVVLQGLESQPDFNGLCGIVNAFDAKCGRYNVIIEIGANAIKRMVKVKVQNLLPCPSGSMPPTAAMSHPPGRASLVLDHMV
jgi:hypothetical protein